MNVELICDAQDFLVTDYWDRCYARITKEEMLTRCSQKYGWPFEVKLTGIATIEFTPSEFKIKYFLRVGNDPEKLLRIYFIHDDAKKFFIVGSLPCHLHAVMIK